MFDLTIKPIYFICAGQESPVWPESDNTMRAAMGTALTAGGHTGRPLDEWEIRDMSGILVSPEEPALLHLGSWFFVTVRVGAGGAMRRKHMSAVASV